MYDHAAHQERIRWFQDARFGMFIHWGIYAIPARGEWVRNGERLTNADYQPFFDAFNPDCFDPAAWARAAKGAGMRYAVLTSKHHDGFCLFDSQLTDYKATNTPCGRDLVREFLDAFRKEGLKVGLYYSLLDWHHPDYPHYGDLHHPQRADKAFAGAEHNFARYVGYLHGQVRELCTNYGKLDILWTDFSYDNMTGEAWRATELTRMVRALQPGILLNNRMEGSGEGYGSLLSGNPSEYAGDFLCPEQIIPPDGMTDPQGRDVCWEACVTMNNHWGYNQFDTFYKPADMLIKKLVECVSKGGNFLLNVGPDARGRIPAPSLDILAGIGRWMADNSQSIYGCGKAGIDKPEYGRVTRRGNKLYYHVFDNPIGYVPLNGLKPGQAKSVRLLSTGAQLSLAGSWITNNYPQYDFVSLGGNPVPPDIIDTVIEVTLGDE